VLSQGDILEDLPLIDNLEETKRTSLQIAERVSQAKVDGCSPLIAVVQGG
jgi:hypothetical protein